jgi:hypothetical protein
MASPTIEKDMIYCMTYGSALENFSKSFDHMDLDLGPSLRPKEKKIKLQVILIHNNNL